MEQLAALSFRGTRRKSRNSMASSAQSTAGQQNRAKLYLEQDERACPGSRGRGVASTRTTKRRSAGDVGQRDRATQVGLRRVVVVQAADRMESFGLAERELPPLSPLPVEGTGAGHRAQRGAPSRYQDFPRSQRPSSRAQKLPSNPSSPPGGTRQPRERSTNVRGIFAPRWPQSARKVTFKIVRNPLF